MGKTSTRAQAIRLARKVKRKEAKVARTKRRAKQDKRVRAAVAKVVRTAKALAALWGVDQAAWQFVGYTEVVLTAQHVADGLPGGVAFCPLWEAFRAAGFFTVRVATASVFLDGVVALFPPDVQAVADGAIPPLPFRFRVPVVPAEYPGGWRYTQQMDNRVAFLTGPVFAVRNPDSPIPF